MDCMIMCGGSGTRLWPLSRNKLPKQFLKLTDEKYSMFQLTVLRAQNIKSISKYYIVSNLTHNFLVKQQMEELGISNYLLVSEPFGKNTCGAISTVSQITDQKLLLVMSSDHIWSDDKFVDSVSCAQNIISNVVVFGIKPTYPETGYGYINYNKNQLIKFVEKPKLEIATEYINSGDYLWNSGNFLFDVDYLNNQLKAHACDIFTMVKETLVNSKTLDNEIKLNPDFFKNVRDDSIDFAVMEHVTGGKVVVYDGYWSDIGSFKSLYDYYSKDSNNNVLQSKTNILNTTNCFVKSDKLVVLNNVKDLTIVDTSDALYIGNTDKAQDIKLLVNEIKKDNKPILEVHTKEYRPWGWYINIIEGSGFKVKRIGVYPGKRLSLQSHNCRSEHWVLVKGTAKLQVGKDFHTITKNQHTYIPVGVLHRIENIGEEDVEFIETQIGDYLGEDDIVRYEDDFGRL